MTLEKKLSLYVAMAAGAAGFAGQSQAQVVYYDLVPDSSLNLNETLDIDLNSDATVDFQAEHQILLFTSSSSTYSYKISNINAQGSNQVVITTTSSYPAVLNLNELINDARDWGASDLLASVSSFGYDWGNWDGMLDKYVGVRFYITGSLHYGWIRLSIPAGGDVCIVKDWAYQSIADSGILAGDEGSTVGVQTALNENAVQVFSHNDKIFVNFFQQLIGDEMIEVYDVSGRLLESQKAVKNRNQIELNASPGIYVVKVSSETGNISKKLVIR